MFVLAYLSYLVTEIRRAAAIREGSFEDGVWGQRIETVSFATLPQNVAILMPGVIAVVAGTLLVRSLVDPVVVQLGRVIKVIAGLAFVIIALGIVGTRWAWPPLRVSTRSNIFSPMPTRSRRRWTSS